MFIQKDIAPNEITFIKLIQLNTTADSLTANANNYTAAAQVQNKQNTSLNVKGFSQSGEILFEYINNAQGLN